MCFEVFVKMSIIKFNLKKCRLCTFLQKFNKKVQVDPYLEDALCSTCHLKQVS